MTLTSCSDEIPVFFLNFCSNSVVVIGFLIKYLLTASSVIPDSLIERIFQSVLRLFQRNNNFKTYLAPGTYEVVGTELKFSNFIFLAAEMSGELLLGLFIESAGTGVTDLELWVLFGFLSTLSFVLLESESDSADESDDDFDFFASDLLFFFFFLSFFLSPS